MKSYLIALFLLSAFVLTEFTVSAGETKQCEAIELPEPGSLGDLFSKIETNDFIKGFCTKSSDNYFDYFTKYFVKYPRRDLVIAFNEFFKNNCDGITLQSGKIKDYFKELAKHKMADLSTGVLKCNVPDSPIKITDKFVIEKKESGSVWMEQLDKAYYPFFYAAKSTEVKTFGYLEDFHSEYYCSTKKTNYPSGCEVVASSSTSVGCKCTVESNGDFQPIYVLARTPSPKDNKTETIVSVVVLAVFGFVAIVWIAIKLTSKISVMSCWENTQLTEQETKYIFAE